MRWLDGITDSMGHEFEYTLRDGKGQGSLVCCGPWGCKESDTTEQLSNKPACTQFTCLRRKSQGKGQGKKQWSVLLFRGHRRSELWGGGCHTC